MDRLQRNLARAWLVVGLGALVAAGLFSVLLVAARTPGVQAIIPWIDFFRTALVVHVDLSVLIWFLAFGGVLWTVAGSPRIAVLEWVAVAGAALGTLIVALSAFRGDANPLLNNYVPTLRQAPFFVGLGLFGACCALKCVLVFASGSETSRYAPVDRVVAVGAKAAALVTLLAFAALAWTYLTLPRGAYDTRYFESLYWGPGHALQFAYTLLLLIAWYWLAGASGARLPVGAAAGVSMILVAAAPAVVVIPWIYATTSPGTAEFTAWFAHLMYWGGPFALPMLLAVGIGILRGRGVPGHERPAWYALICSMVLFLVGGALGFMIEGVNVVIPAHYHGSIVGVTLAFVGLTYHLLPILGYAEPMRRMAMAQPFVYGGGQLLHIAGLAISGGYGNIQRKTAGAAQGLHDMTDLVGMGMMGLGGLIAIIGGLLFVIIVIKAMWPGRDGRR